MTNTRPTGRGPWAWKGRFLRRLFGRRFRGGSFALAALGGSVAILDAALAEASRLPDALAEVEQLRAAHFAGALHVHLGDLWRVNREDTLDALALHDAPDR